MDDDMQDKVKKESSGFIRSRRKKKGERDESQQNATSSVTPVKRQSTNKSKLPTDQGTRKQITSRKTLHQPSNPALFSTQKNGQS